MGIVYVIIGVLILVVISEYSKHQESKKKIAATRKRWKDLKIFK